MEAVRAEVHLVTKENLTEKRISLCQEKNLQNLLYSPTGPLEKPMATAWQQHAEAPRLVTHETDVDEQKEEIFFGIDATITSTRSGIADTGTLIIWPTADEPRSLSLVPPVHFALLEVGNLHNTFAEVLEKRTGAVRCQPMPCLSPVHQNLPISNRHWPMAFMDR